MSSITLSLDRITLEAQIQQLANGHADLLQHLEKAQREVEQYKGALSYSQYLQEQTRKIFEQTMAAKMAAKLAAESAAIAIQK